MWTLAEWFVVVVLVAAFIGLLLYCRSIRDYED